MKKTTLYLPDELQRNLKEAARRTGRPEAAMIREALEVYLTRYTRPRPRSIGAGENGTLSAQDSEAWLREQWGRK